MWSLSKKKKGVSSRNHPKQKQIFLWQFTNLPQQTDFFLALDETTPAERNLYPANQEIAKTETAFSHSRDKGPDKQDFRPRMTFFFSDASEK